MRIEKEEEDGERLEFEESQARRPLQSARSKSVQNLQTHRSNNQEVVVVDQTNYGERLY